MLVGHALCPAHRRERLVGYMGLLQSSGVEAGRRQWLPYLGRQLGEGTAKSAHFDA